MKTPGLFTRGPWFPHEDLESVFRPRHSADTGIFIGITTPWQAGVFAVLCFDVEQMSVGASARESTRVPRSARQFGQDLNKVLRWTTTAHLVLGMTTKPRLLSPGKTKPIFDQRSDIVGAFLHLPWIVPHVK